MRMSRADFVERTLTNSSHGIVEEVVGKTEAVGGWRVEEGDNDAQELIGNGLEVEVPVCRHVRGLTELNNVLVVIARRPS